MTAPDTGKSEFTSFDRWANGLRAGGLHRLGTEGTSGDRCSFLTGGGRDCRICDAKPTFRMNKDCLKDGHPAWYCREIKTRISACGAPERVRQLNQDSAAKYIGGWAAVVAGVAIMVWIFQ